jgi:hypothetical protein
MAPWTRYQLLDISEEQSNMGASKRWLLELLQAVESFPRAFGERLQPLSSRFKQYPALWKTTIIAGPALLLIAVLVGLLASSSKFHGDFASDDVLQYVDPLAGTGLGGAFKRSRNTSLSFDG